MRIGMMADVYKPHVSGITHYIELNKKYLESYGHQVFVFTFGDENYKDDEANIIRSPGLPLLDTGYYLSLRYTNAARKLLSTMDVVHVHHPFLSGALALRYCRPQGIGVVFTNHTRYDLYAKAYLPEIPGMMGITAIQAYLPTFCSACDQVIAPSEGMRQVLKSFGVETPVQVIPNGVDIKPFQEDISPVPREKFGFTENHVVLVYTGRLGPEKNLPFLLRAFGGAAQAYEQTRLLIVGDGPEKENLIDRVHHMGINSRVHFAGMVPYQEIPAYLKAADVFVTASETEVHPLSVIEAMAAGLPVLGIQSPGVGDSVIDGETGYLVAEEDIAAYTAKMVRMVVETEARKRMGKRAAEEAQKYAIERTSKIMVDCYQKAIEKAFLRRRRFRRSIRGVIDRLRR